MIDVTFFVATLTIVGSLNIDDSCPSLTTFDTLEEYHGAGIKETPGYQVFLTDEASKNGAYCLDGSVPDFYFRVGADNGVNKFIFYLQGGGWCASLKSCAQRTGNDLGSSKFDSSVANIAAGAPYLSSNETINPLTYNWNTVYIRYCDGSSYSSNNETILEYNSTLNLYFRGFRILNGVFNVLNKNYNLSLASDVLLTGCSAGALGVFFHADYVYDLITKIKGNENFNYMSMPDAGYFMQVNHYITMMNFNWNYGNLTMSLNQNCVNHYKKISLNKSKSSSNNSSSNSNSSKKLIDETKIEYISDDSDSIIQCMYAPNIAPFIQRKMFSVQSQYDSNQIANMGQNADNATLINQYGQNLTKFYIERFIDTSDNHFGWLVSCYEHCIFSYEMWNHITIDGYTVAQAQVNAWYNNATNQRFLFQNYTYPCDTCCN